MDLNMTATDSEVASVENGVEQAPEGSEDVTPIKIVENLKPVIIGGHDITTMRAHFDYDDKNIIVTSNRQLFYYSLSTGEQVGQASIVAKKLKSDERVVNSEKIDSLLYVFTNHAKVLVWNLETRDWSNQLELPLEDAEVMVSCKMVSKTQYVYTVKRQDDPGDRTSLYYSMSRSERERPKQRDFIGECSLGEQHTFDVGALFSQEDLDKLDKSERREASKQRLLAYMNGPRVYFQKISIGGKLFRMDHKQRISSPELVTCVRVNPKAGMVAIGDTLGRVYIYSGNIKEDRFNRTKLHWHTLPVNDLCFSSTGGTLFSVGGESGCVVWWDLSPNNIGKNRVVARLGMPIRFINCSCTLNQLVLSFEDNEIRWLDTNGDSYQLKTLTRRTIDMYKQNDYRALRTNLSARHEGDMQASSVGLLWHSKTDTVVSNGRTGWLQFYSPKEKSKLKGLNFLRSKILTLEKEGQVIPSDITKASISLDGDWLALYETRETEDSFPEVKLHIWQRSSTTTRWVWIQTADRLHSSSVIVDLKFSPDGQFLISVSDDGSFQVLHRVCLNAKVNANSGNKQMYAKGFFGNVPSGLPSKAAFSQDSSVLAISLKNNTTLIWMIVDPFKLVYECQLNQIDIADSPTHDSNEASPQLQNVLGLHFGHHRPSQSVAPLCEVRTDSIRIWNILNPQETMEFLTKSSSNDYGHLTTSAFDHCSTETSTFDSFAVCNDSNLVMIFKLHIDSNSSQLQPLTVVDASLPFSDRGASQYYTHMCYLASPILDIDEQSHEDAMLLKLINRLCLMNNYQELIGITDRLTIDRQSSSNNCNSIKTIDISDLQSYFAKNQSSYSEETRDLMNLDKFSPKAMTEKQRKIRNRLEVQKMLKDLLIRIPSQNLPQMEVLGPMILDKLI